MPRFRLVLTACLLAIAIVGPVRPAIAQTATQAAAPPQQARETREEFRRLMDGYPPSLGRIFKLDPALLTNASYMAPYPAITAFIQRHPEVARNSGYYFNFVTDSGSYEPRDPEMEMRREALRTYQDMFTGLMVFSGFIGAGLALLWLVRYIVSHRRWLRAFKVQSELHTKLLERFHSSDEVLAYLRSGGIAVPQFSAAALESATPGLAAPFNKILWSIQAGVVLMCGGIGLLIIKRYVMVEAGDMLLTSGVLAASIGIGFVLAAAASYILSRSLGLFDAARDDRAPGV